MESPLCTTAQGIAHITGRQRYLLMLHVSLCRACLLQIPRVEG